MPRGRPQHKDTVNTLTARHMPQSVGMSSYACLNTCSTLTQRHRALQTPRHMQTHTASHTIWQAFAGMGVCSSVMSSPEAHKQIPGPAWEGKVPLPRPIYPTCV